MSGRVDFFFQRRRRHTRCSRDWSSDVCSSDLGGEKIACPKCNHGFPLSEGISRQTIERYAEDFERSVAAHRKKLEAELSAERSEERRVGEEGRSRWAPYH